MTVQVRERYYNIITMVLLYLLAGGVEGAEGRLDEELAVAEERAGASIVGRRGFYAFINEFP